MDNMHPFGEDVLPQPLDEPPLSQQESFPGLGSFEGGAQGMPLDPLPVLEQRAPSVGSCPAESSPQAAQAFETGFVPGTVPTLQQSVSEALHGSIVESSPTLQEPLRTRGRKARCTRAELQPPSDSDSPSLGDEGRKKKRLERNRKSARESRRRKKDYIKNLEAEVLRRTPGR
jgi:hypothetical protein